MPYDKDGNWYAADVVSKGQGKKKKVKSESSKVVPRTARGTASKADVVEALAEEIKETVKDRNNRNRNFGKSVERAVADLTGGARVPASGAIKTSTWGLVGDVQVKYDEGNQVLTLIECKGTSGITPKGGKTYTLKKDVLDQATKEAESLNAMGVVWVHWKNSNYTNDDYVIF